MHLFTGCEGWRIVKVWTVLLNPKFYVLLCMRSQNTEQPGIYLVYSIPEHLLLLASFRYNISFFFLKAEKQREDKRTSWISFKTIRSDLRVSSLAASTRPMRTSDLRGVRWGMKAHSNLRDWLFLRLFWPLGNWGSIMRKKNCFFPYRGSSHFTKFFPTSSF